MSVFGKLTLKTLVKNKTRTVVTIIGVILSAAMICAVTTIIASVLNYGAEFTIKSDGNWYGAFYNSDKGTLDDLLSDDRVNAAAIAENVGYTEIQAPTNKNKPYIFTLSVNDEFLFGMPVYIKEGRMPENENEVILPTHLKKAQSGYNIGDKISLSSKERYTEFVNEETQEKVKGTLDKSTPYTSDGESAIEYLSGGQLAEYEIVGFYQKPSFENYSSPCYTAITKHGKEFSSDTSYDIYFRTKKTGDVEKILEEERYSGVSKRIHNDLLMFYGQSSYGTLNKVLYSLGAILIALIIFGSVSLIGNAFSISLSQRTKQFGLLSSVGATSKQIKRGVLWEGLFISIIGIPLGILAGIFGIFVTFKATGELFTSLVVSDDPLPLRVYVTPVSIIVTVIVCLLTVYISAYIPSKRASKVTAIEAIRQSKDIKISARSVKAPRFIQKLFGLPGLIAYKQFKRNKKAYRATILSLFMSIVLFISASSFTEYLSEGVTGVSNYPCDVQLYSGASTLSEAKDVYEKTLTADNIEKSSMRVTEYCVFECGEEYFSKDFKNMQVYETKNGNYRAPAVFSIIDDEAYIEYLKENDLSLDKYYNTDKPIMLYNRSVKQYSNEKEKFVSIDVMRKTPESVYLCKEPDSDGGEIYLSVEAMPIAVQNIHWSVGTRSEYVWFFMSASMAEKYVRNIDKYGYFSCNCSYMTNKHATLTGDLEIISESFGKNVQIIDVFEMEQNNKNVITLVKVFSYGFIALISLISAANVFNTISTSVSLRRREVAMLKSVGMTNKGLYRMMNYECIIYGVKALLYGIPTALCVIFLIHKAITQGMEMGFMVPWRALIIAVVSVFVVVFASMLYAMSKIRSDNPIDALKNENC